MKKKKVEIPIIDPNTVLGKIVDVYDSEHLLIADGFDSAVIGIDMKTMRLIYSTMKCIRVLMARDKMTEEEAREFFEFNVSGSYVGEKTPIWCEDDF